MQAKTTRAFRTISEAAKELELQPHVLRFWESKFTDINPIKRGGGRRFYRPEDIEFLRGIKVLLHVEKHPIKDVQKLIKKSGANRVVELGRSIERAANERELSDTSLVPARIETSNPEKAKAPTPPPAQEDTPRASKSTTIAPRDDHQDESEPDEAPAPVISLRRSPKEDQTSAISSDEITPNIDREQIEASLAKLEALRKQWDEFRARLDG